MRIRTSQSNEGASMPAASEFTPHIGQVFTIGPASLRLARVDVLPSRGSADAGFMLVFTGPRTPVLLEGLYDAATPGGPALTFYIMPIHTPNQDRQDYQVVFN